MTGLNWAKVVSFKLTSWRYIYEVYTQLGRLVNCGFASLALEHPLSSHMGVVQLTLIMTALPFTRNTRACAACVYLFSCTRK